MFHKSEIIKNIEYLLSLYVNKLINNFFNSNTNNIAKQKKLIK